MRIIVLLSLGLLFPLAASAQTPSYSKHIQPLFTRYCVECHSGTDPDGELKLGTFKDLLRGGKHGPALLAGKPDLSRLVRMIEGKQKPVMPPKKAKQPTKAEIAQVRAWVAAGARDDGLVAKITLPRLAPKGKRLPPVAAVAYSPSGKILAASGRGEVLLLDAATGDLRHRLTGLRDRVTAIAFDKKGQTLAVASSTVGAAHEVRLWTLDPAGKPVGSSILAMKHADLIQDLAFSPDGKLLASASYDRLVKLWDVSAKKESHTLKDHSDSVYGVSFSVDGKLLASVSADRAVKVWDVAKGNRLYTLSESTDWLYAVAFSPDGKHLAAAGVDRSIRVWKVSAREGEIVQSAFAHEGAVLRLVYSSDGKTLWSLGEDRVIKSWNTARMTERKTHPALAGTPLSLAVRPDYKQLAVGQYDGSLTIVDDATGKAAGQFLPLKAKPPILASLSPGSVIRGKTVEWTLTGQYLDKGKVTVTIPGVTLTTIKTEANKLTLRAAIPATALPGTYQVQVQTEGGITKPHSISLDLAAVTAEKEQNDSPKTGQAITLPATITGASDKDGDVDFYRFEAKAGQEVGAQVIAGPQLAAMLRLVDPDGNTVASSSRGFLGHTCAKAGTYALGVRDREYHGGGNRTYRLHIGDIAVVTSIYPLGLARGSEGEVTLEGVHLGKTRTIKVKVPATAIVGSKQPLSLPVVALGSPSLVVGEFKDTIAPVKGMEVTVPGTANGRIETTGGTQTWTFKAKKGQRLILEVEASRLGSPLDSTIEILDSTGRPLPRALLRCLARTYTVFRDHDSRSPGIRIETWGDLSVNDHLLVGSELLKIKALPRNPDDDCQFFAEAGQRVGYLGTTPTHQSQGTPMYKVSIHPPGSKFAPNGLPQVTLFWRNDDGGPGFDKDSRLVFDPPADGTYQVKVGDARGEGSKAHAYRLTVRSPRPDFSVSLFPISPAVNKGGAVAMRVTAKRIDEFDGPITLKMLNLPKGIEAPQTTIPEGELTTAFALYAGARAELPKTLPVMELEAKATIAGKEVVKIVKAGQVRLMEPGQITTTTEESEVMVKPGGEVKVTVKVARGKFDKRIPVDVLGLPHGVRVLDVGLNGILITPTESKRTFVIYCEPWVKATTHPFVVLARIEGTGAEHAAKSVLLRVGKK